MSDFFKSVVKATIEAERNQIAILEADFAKAIEVIDKGIFRAARAGYQEYRSDDDDDYVYVNVELHMGERMRKHYEDQGFLVEDSDNGFVYFWELPQ